MADAVKKNYQIQFLKNTLTGSSANYMQVWTSFGAAFGSLAYGLSVMPIEMERKVILK